jgi:hypothetical protein
MRSGSDVPERGVWLPLSGDTSPLQSTGERGLTYGPRGLRRKVLPHRRVRVFICAVILSLALGEAINVSITEADQPASPKMGGPCEYKAYKGKARIVSVHKKDLPPRRRDPAYQGYEVTFSFHPEERIEESYVHVEGKTYTLLLNNSWYPGPKFIQKYAIEVGKCFEAYLKVITRGSCTPIIFDFPGIDLSDYFESEG